MSKFNTARAPAATSPVRGEATPSTVTHQGGAGYARDTKSELFLLAVTNMVGEHAFYESAGTRDTRYAELVRSPHWTIHSGQPGSCAGCAPARTCGRRRSSVPPSSPRRGGTPASTGTRPPGRRRRAAAGRRAR
ncbi:hypothetical protein [Amycolatopsis sp. NPDC003861]